MERKSKFQPITNCIIHASSVVHMENDNVIAIKNIESWKSLLQAAIIRKYDPILEAAETVTDDTIPDVSNHRECRCMFTMKRDLDALKREAEAKDDQSDVISGIKPMKRKSSESRVYDKVCIFCEKSKCYKGTSNREKLVQACTKKVDETLRQCAKEKQDNKIMAITS
jgi:hypothetical protein